MRSNQKTMEFFGKEAPYQSHPTQDGNNRYLKIYPTSVNDNIIIYRKVKKERDPILLKKKLLIDRVINNVLVIPLYSDVIFRHNSFQSIHG